MDETTESELHSEAAEAALMGALAYHGPAMAHVLTSLAPEAFYRPAREAVWAVARELSAERAPLGPTDIARRLNAADRWDTAVAGIVQREMLEPAPVDLATSYAGTVRDLYERRQLLQVVARMRGDIALRGASASQALALARERLDELDKEDPEAHGAPLPWVQLGAEFDAHQEAPEETLSIVHSPWPSLDDVTGGLVGGRLYVIGGRPGDGKSVAAINCAATGAMAGKHVLVFSQEMSTLEVTWRIYACGASVDLNEIVNRRLTDFSRKKISDYRKRAGNPSLRVSSKPATFNDIAKAARAQKHRIGLDLLVVDYLQLIRSDKPGRTREQEVGQISRDLKLLARELECALVVPAQLNRGSELRNDKRPTKADLRDSGQIEQDADAVILLWPKLDEHGARVGLTFILDKNRHGPKCDLPMGWNGGYSSITDLAFTGQRWSA